MNNEPPKTMNPDQSQREAVQNAGSDFVKAIETAGTAPMSKDEHLSLLDSITDALVNAHLAHDVVWNDYYEKYGHNP